MKKISIFNTKLSSFMVTIIIGIMIAIAMFHYMFFSYEIELFERQSLTMVETRKTLEWVGLESTLDMTTITARNIAIESAAGIVNDIRVKYPDLTVLRNELDSGIYSSKLNQIILDNIRGKYLYNIRNSNNDIVVISRNGIMMDLNLTKFDTTYRSFDDEAKHHFNDKLTYAAIDNIMLHRDSAMIYYEPGKPDDTENHVLIQEPTKEALKDVFMKEGYEGLKGYVVLVPAYITDDGDVFGTPDISSDGLATNNHKIIVVQRFSLYDIVMAHHKPIDFTDLTFSMIDYERTEQIKFKTLSYVGISLLNVVVLLLMIYYTTTHRRSERKNDVPNNDVK